MDPRVKPEGDNLMYAYARSRAFSGGRSIALYDLIRSFFGS
jgi:hypothetical protein